MKQFLENYFEFKTHRTNFKTEFLAGFTTFLTCAYILSVNPMILSSTGMDFNALITATALSSFIATLYMGIFAKLPIALAPGMGLNAFFAYTVVIGMGHSWQYALTAVFLEGLIFIGLTFFNIREAIVDALPNNLKKAISAGIGLFITLIGLVNGGIITSGSGILVKLNELKTFPVMLTLIGIVIISILLVKKINGGLLLGILITTIIGIPLGVTNLSSKQELISMPPSLAPIFNHFEWNNLFTFDMFYIVLTFLFVDMFDTIGVFVGVCEKANLMDKNGKIPRIKQALMADAIGTTFGALLGTSTVTSYVESASGIAQGGKTGFTSIVTGLFFLLALFITPIFAIIPKEATAPVLILVGLFMFSHIREVNFKDMDEGIPAFLAIVLMPFTYSIADGIAFGILSFILIKILTFKFKEVPIPLYFIGMFFLMKFIL